MGAGTSKIPVGQVIAMLAEEGDDLASIEVPKDLGPEGGSSSSSSAPEPKAEAKEEKPQKEEKSGRKEEKQEKQRDAQPAEPKKEEIKHEEAGHGSKQIKHPKPLFPSVARLYVETYSHSPIL